MRSAKVTNLTGALLLLSASCFATAKAADPTNTNDLIGADTSAIIRLRGYLAEDHYFTTPDGYILNIVRATNPLINNGESGLDNKDVILFFHGLLTTANCFVIKSVGATPKDHSNLNAGNLSFEELNELLLDDPASTSLVFTALNFGHEVWLLNNRGTRQSLGHTGNYTELPPLTIVGETLFGGLIRGKRAATSDDSEQVDVVEALGSLLQSLTQPNQYYELSSNLNPKYWNYSLDAQAKYDYPLAIDYVLNKTGRSELALVGHSKGGGVILMAQVLNPDISDKITKSLLWAPGLHMGATVYTSLFYDTIALFTPQLMSYLGPFPPAFTVPIIQTLLATVCQVEATQETLCALGDDIVFGYGGNQVDLHPGYVGNFLDLISSHELVQFVQAIFKTRMHAYDYIDPERNLLAYGQPEAPLYNISTIISKGISIWFGNQDALIPLGNIDLILEDLRVPVELHYLNGPDLYWNHVSFLIHKQIAGQLVIPSLKTIESA